MLRVPKKNQSSRILAPLKYNDPIVIEQRMKFDDLAWEKSDNVSRSWRANLFNEKTFREIGGCIIRHRGGPAEELFNPQKVSFNIMFRMKFLDGGSAILRFPILGGFYVSGGEGAKRSVRDAIH